MDRRQFNAASAGLLITAASQRALALSMQDLTSAEASQGLKTALEKGAMTAINTLGRPDGFMSNPKVRIPLPGFLEDAAKILKTLGQGKRVDELVASMNHAAEVAIPLSKDLLVGAVKNMSVTDAKKILGGGENSVTQFFATKTREPLAEKFLPIVTSATEKVGLAEKYNRVAAKAAELGMVKKEDANIQKYVTGKSLDGLFTVIGDEEKKLRQDPLASGSALLKKVFGAIK